MLNSNKKVDISPILTLSGSCLEAVFQNEYSGMTIDNKLYKTNHIDDIYKKAWDSGGNPRIYF